MTVPSPVSGWCTKWKRVGDRLRRPARPAGRVVPVEIWSCCRSRTAASPADGQRDAGEQAEHPAAHRPQLGPLGQQQAREAGHRGSPAVRRHRRRVELDGVAGQLHVRLLQRGPVRGAARRTAARAAVSSADDPLAGQPVDGDASSGSVAATVAPALASTVIASVRCGGAHLDPVLRRGGQQRRARSCRRSAGRGRSTIRWSAVSSSSLIRWLETRTARPSAASDRSRPADPDDALRVEPVDRLVEHQHRRVAEQRGGDAEPLPHAEREAAGPAPGRRGQADLLEHLVDPAARRCRCCAPATAGGRGPAGRGAAPTASSSAPTCVQRRRAASGTAGRRPARSPSSGGVQPEDQPHRRGLAGAVGPDEAGDLARPRR